MFTIATTMVETEIAPMTWQRASAICEPESNVKKEVIRQANDNPINNPNATPVINRATAVLQRNSRASEKQTTGSPRSVDAIKR